MPKVRETPLCKITGLSTTNVSAMSDEHLYVQHAYVYMTAAHAAVSQTRKSTGAPYSEHPKEVTDILRRHGITCPDTLAAAMLHDVIEDTSVTKQDLLSLFRPKTVKMVMTLSDPEKDDNVTRAENKLKIVNKLSKASPKEKDIKCADIISNGKDIWEHLKKFAPIYFKEVGDLLPVLKGGTESLWKEAHELYLAYFKERMASYTSATFERTTFARVNGEWYLKAVSKDLALRIIVPDDMDKCTLGSLITQKQKLTINEEQELFIDGVLSKFKVELLSKR